MKKLKLKLLNFLMRHLFNAVTSEDIVQKRGNKYYLRGKALTVGEINDYKVSFASMRNSKAFKEIMKTIQAQANYRMYQGSNNTEDLVFGKAMLYNIVVIEEVFKGFEKIK